MLTTWSIQQLNRDLLDDLVTIAHWGCTVTDGDYSASNYGSVGFERGETFVEYDKLTQDEVLGWVKAKLDVDAIEFGLQSHIEGIKTPVSATGVPW
jgi:hypothetical protein